MQNKEIKESKENTQVPFEQRNPALVQRLQEAEHALTSFLEKKLPLPAGATEEARDAILQKRKAIMDILDIYVGAPTYKKKCEKLNSLYHGLPSSGFFGKVWDKTTVTPREQIKTILKGSNKAVHFRDIDALMMEYVKVQNEVMVKQAAYRYAVQQADAIQRMKEQYPGAQIDVLILKRHEVCTNLHKAAYDTDLDAFATGFKGNQSKFELQTTQEIQTQRVVYLKEMGLIGKVKTFVSPVTRAHRTHEYATFQTQVIDEVEFNADFAEKSSWVSGKATVSTAKLAKKFEKNIASHEGKKPKITSQGELVWSEGTDQFQERLTRAEHSLFADFKPAEKGATEGSLVLVAGHGAFNREMLLYLEKKHGKSFDGVDFRAAAEIALDFGSQHNVLVARDPDGKILGMRFTGITTNFGEEQAPPSINKLLKGLEKNIEKEKGYKLAPSVAAYCSLQQDSNKLHALIEKHPQVFFDNLNAINTSNINGIEATKFIINTCFIKECSDVEGKKRTSFEFPKAYVNLLKQLKTPGKGIGFDGFVDKKTMSGILEEAKAMSGAGKIVTLIEAIAGLREKEMALLGDTNLEQKGLGEQEEFDAPVSFHIGIPSS